MRDICSSTDVSSRSSYRSPQPCADSEVKCNDAIVLRCVFVQSKLVMEGFRSLREGEQVEFTFKRSSKGLESLRVTGPGGGPCSGSDRRPKGKAPPLKRKPKGDR
ncbi:hypothetical protein SRHO_G00075160 [Serrasalmus rhombeus]